jgi:predicted DCC family thiol-disulfide oxidoreductase YuxK
MLLKINTLPSKLRFTIPKFDFPETLALDTRSLAVLRIAIGLLILADLLARSQDLVAHYTEAGIMPHSLLLSNYLTAGTWSLFLINGDIWTTQILFVITGICAIGLIGGYRTRLFTFLCWILVSSLQARNRMIFDGGDDTIRLVLFWGMFLPLGARFSIDSVLDLEKKTPNRFMNMAAVAYTLQIAYIYWFAFLWKANPVWLSEFRGAYYAIQMDFFASPLGHWLRNFPALMPTFDIATIVIELFGPFLLFIPSKKYAWIFRCIVVVNFILMHFSFGSFLEIGLFTWISASTWLAFIPSQVWDKLQNLINTSERSQIKIYYDRECMFCFKTVLLLKTLLILPTTQVLPAQSEAYMLSMMRGYNSWIVVDSLGNEYLKFSGIVYLFKSSPIASWLGFLLALLRPIGDPAYEWIANRRKIASKLTKGFSFYSMQIRETFLQKCLIASLICLIVFMNIANLRMGAWGESAPPLLPIWIANVLRINQGWSMFAPVPMRRDGWFVVMGTLANSSAVNLLNPEQSVTWEKPEIPSAIYKNQRWRKYHADLWGTTWNNSQSEINTYAQYHCRAWNKVHSSENQLWKIRVSFMEEFTLPDFATSPLEQRILKEAECEHK